MVGNLDRRVRSGGSSEKTEEKVARSEDGAGTMSGVQWSMAEVGELLYGKRWRSQMAVAMEVSEQTVRLWEREGTPLSPERRERLRKIVEDQVRRLREIVW